MTNEAKPSSIVQRLGEQEPQPGDSMDGTCDKLSLNFFAGLEAKPLLLKDTSLLVLAANVQ